MNPTIAKTISTYPEIRTAKCKMISVQTSQLYIYSSLAAIVQTMPCIPSHICVEFLQEFGQNVIPIPQVNQICHSGLMIKQRPSPLMKDSQIQKVQQQNRPSPLIIVQTMYSQYLCTVFARFWTKYHSNTFGKYVMPNSTHD